MIAVAPVAIAPIAAALIALALIRPARGLALRLDLTDRPAAHKPHTVATPYLGGAAILLATLGVTVAAARPWTPLLAAVCLAAFAIGVLGLADDLRPQSARLRLAVEAVLSVCLVAMGLRAPITGIDWFDSMATVIWLVVIVNSYNLLDNSDGALASVTIATAGVIAAGAALGGRAHVTVLLLALAGATSGFTRHNWPPATIFLGDAGSLFIGFILAAASVWACTTADPGPGVAAWLLLTGFAAVADTATVVVSRLRAGRSIMHGGTDHLAHRLRGAGLTQPRVAATLGGLSALAGAMGLAALTGLLAPLPTLVTALAALAMVTAVANHHKRFQPRPDPGALPTPMDVHPRSPESVTQQPVPTA